MRELTPSELKDRLAEPNAPLVLDVREPWEADICKIEGSLLMPMASIPKTIDQLPLDRDIVVVCHLAVRSAHVVHFLEAQGFDNVINLAGGIDAWAATVDPSMATY
jgi:rhodanese-related sulfurtransferase